MEPDNCPDGVSDVSPRDVASAGGRAMVKPNGSNNGAQRRNKGARRSVGLKRKNDRKTVSRTEEPAPRPQAGSLERTKRLLMAALRVWELKQGIRG